ncbi:hypothetical protein N5094_10855 [Shewanella putrefaciens]|uniref:hypothetical protein n=1 Tax=Shewanella TaxID=22 RepID=UPI0020062FD0|nr:MULTISPECIES: hypothetical protein [Shewanella]MCK7633014.1 hypothetical protein [Shewanella sp. JNE17]MCK7648387.1 hypothetical protein [Shewanella sp. JNE8]MCK7656481.1 hypothetical protein [Shewanella sp. JNE4-2]UPO32972.1 hypothetical protein MZ182_09175 [Shewanella sp. JNE2]UXK06936.1 hypothetical protein N5094_10855 [Shewanella putrefaciens]
MSKESIISSIENEFGDIFEHIEATAYTYLSLYAEVILSQTDFNNDNNKGSYSLKEASECLTLAPYNLVEMVSEYFGQDIHKFVKPSDLQFSKGKAFILSAITPTESTLKTVASTYSSIFNPIGKFVKELMVETTDSAEYKRLMRIYRTFGLDLVLGAFDELICRGTNPKELLSLLYDVSEQLIAKDASLSEYILLRKDLGMINGACDEKQARLGETFGGIGGGIAGAKVGAMVGSIIPGFGTVIGASAGFMIGKSFGSVFGNALGQEDKTDKEGP